jgi:FtsH-binding integral membrane protein
MIPQSFLKNISHFICNKFNTLQTNKQINLKTIKIMEKSIKAIAVNYGVYLGVGLAIITAVCYAMDVLLLTNMWLGIGLLILVLGISIFSSVSAKKAQNGIISFKEAFTAFFITLVIGLLISSIVYIIIFNFVDPEAANILKEALMDKQINMMKDFGADSNAIAMAAEEFEKMENMYSIGNVLQSFVFQLIGYSIVGLISSLIIKKTEE